MAGYRHMLKVAAVFLSVSLTACDADRIVPVGQGVVTPSTLVSVAIVPSPFSFQLLPVFGCPTVSPFTSSFVLLLDQRGGADVFLHEVRFRFFDVSGFVSPVLFTRTDLIGLFGSPFVPAGATRSFAFRPQFGCGFPSPPHSLNADLLLVDRQGRRHQHTLTAKAR